jgi:hypothetical protein
LNSSQLSLEEIERYWGSLEVYNEEQRRSGLEVLDAGTPNVTGQGALQNFEMGSDKVETVVSTKVRKGLRRYLGVGLIRLGQWFAHHTNSHNI